MSVFSAHTNIYGFIHTHIYVPTEKIQACSSTPKLSSLFRVEDATEPGDVNGGLEEGMLLLLDLEPGSCRSSVGKIRHK